MPFTSWGLNTIAVNNLQDIAHADGDLVVCVRYVNYRVDSNGGYVNREHITTKNVIRTILGGGTLDPIESIWEDNGISGTEYEMGYDDAYNGRYVGIEDLRHFFPS